MRNAIQAGRPKAHEDENLGRLSVRKNCGCNVTGFDWFIVILDKWDEQRRIGEMGLDATHWIACTRSADGQGWR